MSGTPDNKQARRFAEAVAEGMYAGDFAARGWGVRIEAVRPHYALARMTVREDMLNSHGVCHGAILFALADTAFAYAANSENRATLATMCSITFTAAVPVGAELTAIAEKRTRGRRTGVYDVTVTDANGETVALFRGNSYQVKGESAPGLGPAPGAGGND
ncbi:MAG: hydroxyphenylacetyl-CoA thioesterase PaaI [Alphaproteobacteria bacterium]